MVAMSTVRRRRAVGSILVSFPTRFGSPDRCTTALRGRETAEGQAVSRRMFRAVRAVSRKATVAVTAASNTAHCSPDKAGPMASGW